MQVVHVFKVASEYRIKSMVRLNFSAKLYIMVLDDKTLFSFYYPSRLSLLDRALYKISK